MSINLFILIPSVLLILIPRRWLRIGRSLARQHSSRARISNPRDDREPGDNALRVGEEFGKLRNYIDLLRGVAGSYGVMQFSFVLPADPDMNLRLSLMGVKAVILVAALMVQMLRYDGRLCFVAPVFFLSGLSAGICGWDTALYGSATAWIFNAMLPNPAAFLVAQGVLVGAFGAIFSGPFNRMVMLAGLLNVLPAVISFLLKRPLAISSKRQRG